MSSLKRRYGVLLLVFVGLVALASQTLLPVAEVTVDWNTTYQTIDGFGGSVTGYTGTFTREQADEFFDPSIGLGLSLLRIRATPSTLDADCDCVSNSRPYSCVTGTRSQILTGDLQIATLAADRGVKLFAAPWSPPASMKTSGKYCSGGSLIGTSRNYTEYAADLADFPALLASKGLSVEALSVQNEPDVENPMYDTCKWTAQQLHDFIPYLWDALKARGFASVRIALPEEGRWTFERMRPAIDDPTTSGKVGLILGHAYGTDRPAGVPSTKGLHVWQTEVSTPGRYEGEIADGIDWAQQIHNYLIAGTNAWMYWSLDCGPRHFNHDNNMCLTDQSSNLSKRAYVLGQYAKFVRPGWQRIGIDNDSHMLVTAFRGPDKDFAIVAVNDGRWLSRKNAFHLRGFTSQHSQIVPWLTSATSSLEAQAPVTLGTDGGTFEYTMPARSVVTFQGRAD